MRRTAAAMHFTHPLFLIGLAAVAVPPLVRRLARLRCAVVEWAAMRFLRPTPPPPPRVWLRRWLPVGAWMAALGLAAVALAGPAVRSTAFVSAADRRPRCTALLVDCSASMGQRRGSVAALDAAREWATAFVAAARPGDRVAVFAVKADALPVVGPVPADLGRLRGALDLLPPSRGSADWPAAVEAAARVLEGVPEEAEIVVLADGQRFGWADGDALDRWDGLARTLAAAGKALPRVWVADVTADRPDPPTPTGLRPLTADRAVTTPDVALRFESGVHGDEPADTPPYVRLEIDGRSAGLLTPSPAAPGAAFPLNFARRFPLGSHLVTLRLGGDRQDFALEVLPAIPAGPPAAINLVAGEPLVYRPPGDDPPAPVTILRPDGTSTAVPVQAWPAVYAATREPGPYRLTTAAGRVRYYAVRTDSREYDSTRADAADRENVARRIDAVEYVSGPDDLQARRGRGPVTWEFGGLVFAAAAALAVFSLWYSRRSGGAA